MSMNMELNLLYDGTQIYARHNVVILSIVAHIPTNKRVKRNIVCKTSKSSLKYLRGLSF